MEQRLVDNEIQRIYPLKMIRTRVLHKQKQKNEQGNKNAKLEELKFENEVLIKMHNPKIIKNS